MEWLALLAVAVPVILLFVANGRMRSEIDRLQTDAKIVGSELKRLTQLYEALRVGGITPSPTAAATVAATAPGPDAVTTTPPEPATAAPVAPDQPIVEPIQSSTEATPLDEMGSDIAADFPPPPPPPTPPTAPPPKKRFEWERFLGVRLPIWIGAVALCIAGFFFVSYAIESGLFGPEFRVLAGIIAALAFLAGGEFVRRRARSDNSANIAAALASASIATFYATAYIASAVYALVPEMVGFVAMAGVTVLAIVIALAFGQVVAMIGLIGGYVTPALFASDAPSALFLFAYLTAIHLAFFAAIRVKSWWPLSPMALFGPLIWIVLWLRAPVFDTEPWPAIVFLVLVTVIVALAAWDTWREDGEPLWIVGGTGGWERRALPLAAALSALGFLAFVNSSGQALPFWQGLIAFGALTVAASFYRPNALGYLQIFPLAAALLALIVWRDPQPGEVEIMTGICAVVFGFGALDQFRRLQRPAIWAAVICLIALGLFGVLLFKVTGWQAVLGARHFWAAGALLLAAALMALLWVFGPRVHDEQERSRVYAILAAGVTSLVSLAVVIELDPTLFPAASALAVLGLAAVYTRVPVRGLRVLAAVYAAAYAVLIIGAGGELVRNEPSLATILALSLRDGPIVLLILPGIAFLGASTLFRRHPQPWDRRDVLCDVLDVTGVVALALGILYLARPGLWEFRDFEAFIFGAWTAGPLALLAAVAAYLGRRGQRTALYYAGLVLALIVALGILAHLLAPIYRFWPSMSLPSFWVFDVSWLALGLPGVILVAMGRFVRQDENRAIANYGRGLAAFGIVAIYTLMLIQIRRAYQGGDLLGPMGSAENYTYSVATLAYGIGLLVIGMIIRNPLPRALSLVFVLAATVKVFLFDAGSLEGLWRVLSFLGMGLSFLGISWAYARYVFGLGRGPKAAPPPAAAAPAD